MIRMKNESGIALVLTLSIITVSMLVLTVLFYQINQTTAQITMTERNIDARNLTKMGVTYYNQIVKENSDHWTTHRGNINDLKAAVENFHRNGLPLQACGQSTDSWRYEKQLDADRKFQLYLPIDVLVEENRITILYEIVGISNDVTVREVASFTIDIE